ncbi:universal stress protein [Aquabacterium sp.]|uniref:universal stress protein n=1 Tax=Aquabacterium sp. TaxID=1872578 RepID=UPI002BF4D493|nr:universal stress protein [Aquabacterium sp.]HSW07580.1 universal stress protein [Aquabacterium sp.]
MNILIPVDGSTFTKRMLAYLAAHDEWLGQAHSHTLVHVAPPVPPRAAAALDKEILKSHYADESEKVFKPIRSFFEKQGLKATFVAKVGHAADVIAELADKGKFDLLMMGSHGHSLLGSLVLGSVTTKVLAHCSTPVLIVR